IGKQAPVPELQPHDAQNRFRSLFRRLLAVLAQPGHPLVLFLDDMHWAGPSTIELLVDVLSWQELSNVLVVGAYRDDDPGAALLVGATAAIRDSGGQVTAVPLLPLSIDDVVTMVGDRVHSTEARVQVFGEVVHAKTGGNPFFAVQFLRALIDEGLLRFDRT